MGCDALLAEDRGHVGKSNFIPELRYYLRMSVRFQTHHRKKQDDRRHIGSAAKNTIE
jgi:hypothetical protein